MSIKNETRKVLKKHCTELIVAVREMMSCLWKVSIISFDRGLEELVNMLTGTSVIEIKNMWTTISVPSVQRERLRSGMKDASSSILVFVR